MSQVQVIGARINRTVYLHGRICNAGYYSEADGRLSPQDYQHMLDYEGRQSRLAPELRDVPPIYKVDVIPLDRPAAEGGFEFVDYAGKSIGELRSLCQKRGIPYTRKEPAASLAKKLADYDKTALSWTKMFKDLNQFMEMTDAEKLEYLDKIAAGPDDMEPDSDDAAEYAGTLIHAVEMYSAQSQSEEVVAKLREVLDQYKS